MGLALASEASACVCAARSPEQALDEADAAVVGRIEDSRVTDVDGLRQTVYRIEVLQRVKGDLPDEIEVRSPLGTDCDLEDAVAPAIQLDGVTGLLLTRSRDGTWLANVCSVVVAGELVAAGGEPRGTMIKVGIGLVILGLVLAWALRRRARGTRPDLPGAPEP